MRACECALSVSLSVRVCECVHMRACVCLCVLTFLGESTYWFIKGGTPPVFSRSTNLDSKLIEFFYFVNF